MIGPSIMKNIGPELKTTIYNLNGSDLFSLVATASLLTGVDQGPAINQRIGNMINCKRIRIRMNTNATSIGGSGTTKFEFDFCRVVLATISRADTQPLSTFYYVGQGSWQLPQVSGSYRFRVIKEWFFDIWSHLDADVEGENKRQQVYLIDEDIPINIISTFRGTGGTWGDTEEWPIFLWCIGAKSNGGLGNPKMLIPVGQIALDYYDS